MALAPDAFPATEVSADGLAADLAPADLAFAALAWNSLLELMDAQADPELLAAVRREAMAVAGVMGVEKLHARKAGLEYLVDIHVEVDEEWTVRQGHEIAHAVKDRVLAAIVPVKDVLVHVEPAPHRGR